MAECTIPPSVQVTGDYLSAFQSPPTNNEEKDSSIDGDDDESEHVESPLSGTDGIQSTFQLDDLMLHVSSDKSWRIICASILLDNNGTIISFPKLCQYVRGRRKSSPKSFNAAVNGRTYEIDSTHTLTNTVKLAKQSELSSIDLVAFYDDDEGDDSVGRPRPSQGEGEQQWQLLLQRQERRHQLQQQQEIRIKNIKSVTENFKSSRNCFGEGGVKEIQKRPAAEKNSSNATMAGTGVEGQEATTTERGVSEMDLEDQEWAEHSKTIDEREYPSQQTNDNEDLGSGSRKAGNPKTTTTNRGSSPAPPRGHQLHKNWLKSNDDNNASSTSCSGTSHHNHKGYQRRFINNNTATTTHQSPPVDEAIHNNRGKAPPATNPTQPTMDGSQQQPKPKDGDNAQHGSQNQINPSSSVEEDAPSDKAHPSGLSKVPQPSHDHPTSQTTPQERCSNQRAQEPQAGDFTNALDQSSHKKGNDKSLPEVDDIFFCTDDPLEEDGSEQEEVNVPEVPNTRVENEEAGTTNQTRCKSKILFCEKVDAFGPAKQLILNNHDGLPTMHQVTATISLEGQSNEKDSIQREIPTTGERAAQPLPTQKESSAIKSTVQDVSTCESSKDDSPTNCFGLDYGDDGSEGTEDSECAEAVIAFKRQRPKASIRGGTATKKRKTLTEAQAKIKAREEEIWEGHYKDLQTYKEKHGHSNVPKRYKEKGLGTWVNEQRRKYKKEILAKERRDKLESIEFVWSQDAQWQAQFEALQEYKASNGNCNVPQGYKPNPKLGVWVQEQRNSYKKGKLTKDRIKKLESIDFVWHALDAQWQAQYEALQEYKASNGNCNVPRGYKPNPKLGVWVKEQRQNYRKGILLKEQAKERLDKLESIGFVWKMK